MMRDVVNMASGIQIVGPPRPGAVLAWTPNPPRPDGGEESAGLAELLGALAPFLESVEIPSAEATEAALYPEEEVAVARAVEKRRRDFTLGRACARAALASLGATAGPIPVAEGRAPVWPGGVVGAITHCRGLAAAAVGLAVDYRGIGLDAEEASPMGAKLIERISTEGERDRIARHPPLQGACWGKVIFSAKEAVYKAVSPPGGTWLGFKEVEVELDPEAGRFTARLVGRTDAPFPPAGEVAGHFAVGAGLVVALGTVPAT